MCFSCGLPYSRHSAQCPGESTRLAEERTLDAMTCDACGAFSACEHRTRINPWYVRVDLEEEYGYRTWTWFTLMDPTDLESWWTKLPSVRPYFFSPIGLPGRVEPRPAPPFTTVEAALARLNAPPRPIWRCHIHQDDDSYLVTPAGRCIYHAGARV